MLTSSKTQKWLQYETVLGPESDGPDEAAEPDQSKKNDDKKDVEKANTPRRLDVSGPGIGDLHTAGDRTSVRFSHPIHDVSHESDPRACPSGV